MEVLQVIMLAFIVEAVWETGKLVWEDGRVSIDRIGALILGLTVAIGYRVDLLASIGITSHNAFLGVFLTGVLISRGGNYIHDLVDRLSK